MEENEETSNIIFKRVDEPTQVLHLEIVGKINFDMFRQMRDLADEGMSLCFDLTCADALDSTFAVMLLDIHRRLDPSFDIRVMGASPENLKMLKSTQISGPIKIDGLPAHAIFRTWYASDANKAKQLSEFDRRLLGLIACGWSSESIAEKLGLLINTVNQYQLQLFSRLGIFCLADTLRLMDELRVPAPPVDLNQRKEGRHRLLAYLKLNEPGFATPIGRLVDLSGSGIRVMSEHAIKPGSSYQLELPVHLAGANFDVNLQGTVQWNKRLDEFSSFENGFTITPQGDSVGRENIDKIISHLSKKE